MLPVRALIGRLSVALGIGFVIGLERERRKGSVPTRTPAAVRALGLEVCGELLLGITSGGSRFAWRVVPGLIAVIAAAWTGLPLARPGRCRAA